MANLRNSPPQRPRPGCSSLTWGPDPGHPHPHPSHAAAASPLASGFQEFYARRFQLATWLLKQHSRLGAQRATAALILLLGNVLLAIGSMLLSFLGAVIGGGQLPLLRLLLLIGATLTLICTIVSALFAMLAAMLLRSDGAAVTLEIGALFHSGAGASPFQDEAHFKDTFRQATQQQMLDSALSEVYTQERTRNRQERWLWRAMVVFALALLLFTLVTFGMVIGVIS